MQREGKGTREAATANAVRPAAPRCREELAHTFVGVPYDQFCLGLKEMVAARALEPVTTHDKLTQTTTVAYKRLYKVGPLAKFLGVRDAMTNERVTYGPALCTMTNRTTIVGFKFHVSVKYRPAPKASTVVKTEVVVQGVRNSMLCAALRAYIKCRFRQERRAERKWVTERSQFGEKGKASGGETPAPTVPVQQPQCRPPPPPL